MKHSQMPRRPQAQPRAAGLQGGVTGPRKGNQPPAKPPRGRQNPFTAGRGRVCEDATTMSRGWRCWHGAGWSLQEPAPRAHSTIITSEKPRAAAFPRRCFWHYP